MPNGHWNIDVPPAVLAGLRGRLNAPEAYVGIRPEHLVIAPGAPGPNGEVAGEIYTRQILGTEVLYEIKTGDGLLRAVTPSTRPFEIGSTVRIGVDWTNILFFDRATEATILAF
jgi:sn-glycerol 3-phosphate transport system ATP-binding protein